MLKQPGLVERRTHPTALAGVLGLLLSMGAAIEVPAAEGDSKTQDQRSESSTQIEEIIVHAQRREEPLQKVPVSVTPVSGADLATRKVNDLTQLSVAVPSLAVGESNYYSVRGIGSLAGSSLLDSSVGVSVDDVSLGVPGNMSNGILDDVSQIEVLSGPQGLLFGRNASAGLINIVSNKPVIDSYEGQVSAELDNRDTDPAGHFGAVARATINLPVSEKSALRLNLSESYQDPIVKFGNEDPPGVRRNDFQHNSAIKAKYLWEPTSALSVYLIGDYSHERGVGGGPFDLSYRVASPFGLAQLGLAADGNTAGANNLKAGADAPLFSDVDTGGVSLNVSYELSPALTLSNIAAWRTFRLNQSIDFDYSSLPIFNKFANQDRYTQYSDELRLAFQPNQVIDGQAGLYLFDQDQPGHQQALGSVLTGIPNFAGSDLVFDRKGFSVAEYGQVNLHATNQLQFLVGARATTDHVSINETQNTGNYVVTAFGPKNGHADQSYDHTNVSYKVGAQYQFQSDIMGYVTYSTGYKGPSFNQSLAVLGQDLTVRPETANNLELGVKTTFFDNRLRFNVAGFIENFNQLQVQNYDPILKTFVIGNAATARSEGVEISGVAKPVGGLTINFGATFQNAKFRDFPGDPCYIGQTTPSCAINQTFNGAGLAVPTSARFTSTLQAIYEFPLGRDATGFVEGNYYHRSPVSYSAAADPLLRLGDVNTLGFSFGARFKRIELTLFCKDCTDNRVPTALIPDSIDVLAGASSVTQSWNYNSVRTLGLTASYVF